MITWPEESTAATISMSKQMQRKCSSTGGIWITNLGGAIRFDSFSQCADCDILASNFIRTVFGCTQAHTSECTKHERQSVSHGCHNIVCNVPASITLSA